MTYSQYSPQLYILNMAGELRYPCHLKRVEIEVNKVDNFEFSTEIQRRNLVNPYKTET